MWVHVREPGSRAKKPDTAKSQLPACNHKEHRILSTEATTFAAQYRDRKTYPTKAAQQEFVATCIDVNVDKNLKYKHQQKYAIKRWYLTKCVGRSAKHSSTLLQRSAHWGSLWSRPTLLGPLHPP